MTDFELRVHSPAGESKRCPHSHESNSSFNSRQTIALIKYRLVEERSCMNVWTAKYGARLRKYWQHSGGMRGCCWPVFCCTRRGTLCQLPIAARGGSRQTNEGAPHCFQAPEPG